MDQSRAAFVKGSFYFMFLQVLTPEELLFRGVQLINESHNAVGAPLDAKLRSLVALAVSEQCLHLWFDLLCSGDKQECIRKKFYHSWSFIRSPAWRQVAFGSFKSN